MKAYDGIVPTLVECGVRVVTTSAGVDALVVEGVEGGGFKHAQGASTLVLLPLIAGQTDLPIIAAGGICDARSMAAALVLGTVMISPPGLPTMRVLKTARAAETAETNDPGDGLARILDLYFEGDLEASFASLDQVSGRIDAIRPVAEIIREMWDGVGAALDAARDD